MYTQPPPLGPARATPVRAQRGARQSRERLVGDVLLLVLLVLAAARLFAATSRSSAAIPCMARSVNALKLGAPLGAVSTTGSR